MPVSVRSLAVLGLLTLPGTFARAEEPPDVQEILRKADANTKAVKAVSYDASFFGEGDPADVERIFSARGKVIAREGRRSLMSNIFGGSAEIVRYEGEARLPGADEWLPFVIACDGRSVYRLDPLVKTYTRGALPTARQLLRHGRLLLMLEFIHPTPFSDELEAKSTKYEGVKEVEGVACHVIYVIYRNNSESRWYFGKEDYLPRRVDRILANTKGSAQVLVISNLNTNPAIDNDTFRLQKPDDYVERFFDADLTMGMQDKLLPVGSTAPDFSLKTPDDKLVSLKDLRGNVVVLDFWATWCGPCKLAMPGVQRLHEKFKDHPVKVYGISTWERKDADPAGYMKEGKYTYGLLLKGDEVAESYKLEGLPTFYIIDTGGRILYASTGFLPDKESEIAEIITKALKSK